MERYRATTSTGAVVDQPNAVQLADLVAEVDRSGRHAFLVVTGQTGSADMGVQARRTPDGWTLELRDGRSGRQFQAQSTDPALVYSAVAYWVLRSRTYAGLAWQQLRHRDVALPLTAGLAV